MLLAPKNYIDPATFVSWPLAKLLASVIVLLAMCLMLLIFPARPAFAQAAAVNDDHVPVSPQVQELASTQPEHQVAAAPITPFYEKSNAAPNANKATTKVGSAGHLLNVALGLAAIVGLIYALSLFAKRFTSGTFSTNTHLKIISTMPLGTRERIILIDAGGQQLLLGITPTNISTLHAFTQPIAMNAKPDTHSDFSQKLMAILQQKPVVATPDNKNNSAPQE